MEYDWEDDVPKSVFDDAGIALQFGPYKVMGVAVENTETGEGAFLVNPECPVGGVIVADIWQDINGDTERLYHEAVEAIFGGGQIDNVSKQEAPEEVLVITDKMLDAGVSWAARVGPELEVNAHVMAIFMAMINEYEGRPLVFATSENGPFFKAKTAERMI